MNNHSRALLACACVALTFSAKATIYSDATGENFTAAGGGILDISSVEVTSTATDLIFKINVTGDPVATDWGKYLIALNTVPGGDTVGNGWGRPISMPAGMDYWMGSWVDSGNAVQVFGYSGSWSQIGAVGSFAGGPAVPGLAISKNSSSLTITTPLSLLGLSAGNTLVFDVFTSGGGGGDGAVDALSSASQSIGDWGNSFSSQSTLSFTIPQVPEPASLTFLGVGSLLLINRMRRR